MSLSVRQAFSPVTWEQLYLIRTYHKDADPYAVVSDLPPDKALEICNRHEPRRGFDDSGDQSLYLNTRRRIEAWLRQNAWESRVKIDKKTPVYFSLSSDPTPFIDAFIYGKPNAALARAMEARPDRALLVLPASDLDLSNWSFTMDDSFLSYRAGVQGKTHEVGAHPLHGKVLSARQLIQELQTNGLPKDSYNGMPRYFEAQLWASKPLFRPAATNGQTVQARANSL